MSRITDFRIDTVELTLTDYQRLEDAAKLAIDTYGTWLKTPQQAVITDGVVRFEIPIYRWHDIGFLEAGR